jgi:hypothetical protein
MLPSVTTRSLVLLALLTASALPLRADPMGVVRLDGNALRTTSVGQSTPFADALYAAFQRVFWGVRREVCRFHREMLEGRHVLDLDFPTCPAGGVLSIAASGSLLCPYHDAPPGTLVGRDDADFRKLMRKLVQLQIFVHAPWNRPTVASACVVTGTGAEYKNQLLGLDANSNIAPPSLPVNLTAVEHVLEITPLTPPADVPMLVDRKLVERLSRAEPAVTTTGGQPPAPPPLLRATFLLEPDVQRLLESAISRLGQTASAPSALRVTLGNQNLHIELAFADHDSAQAAEQALGAGLGALELARAFERQRPELEVAALLLSGSHWVDGHDLIIDRRLPDTIPALAGEAIQGWLATRESPREPDTKCARACHRGARALYAWQIERGKSPSNLDDLVEYGYLEDPVRCPMGGALSISADGLLRCEIHSPSGTR